MGCSASKLDLKEEEVPPGLKPIQRKIEDAKNRIRRRRYSIVSTTELLSQENVASDSSNSGKTKTSAIVPEPIDEEKEVSVEVKTEIREDDIRAIEGPIPGSPSFRFYCMDLPENNNQSFDSTDSVKLPEFKRAEDMKETKEKNCETKAKEESQDSTEGSEGKIVKKERGRKLLSLPTVKTPNAVQNLLTCYSFTTPSSSNNSKPVT